MTEQVQRRPEGIPDRHLVGGDVRPKASRKGQARDDQRCARARAWLALLVGVTATCGTPARMRQASSVLYVRQDTDHTTIISPRVSAAASVGQAVTVEASETMDAWTGASVDIVTAATGTVRERRYETNLGLRYETDGWLLGLAYRNSTEPDYGSHGGVLRLARDFAEHNSTLALAVFGSADTVGRAGDPGFRRPLHDLGARLTLTQVLGPRTIAELGWETTLLHGYLASPYRFVAIGGDGVCANGAPYCIPESVPDERVRHAPTVRLRQALGARASVGLGYRFYVDDWGLRSHTVEPEVTWLVSDVGTLSFAYRGYTQNDARFYRPRYFAPGPEGWATRDRKLSAFFTHAAAMTYVHELRPRADGPAWDLGLRVGVERFRYLAFVGLEHVTVLDVTGMLRLRFE